MNHGIHHEHWTLIILLQANDTISTIVMYSIMKAFTSRIDPSFELNYTATAALICQSYGIADDIHCKSTKSKGKLVILEDVMNYFIKLGDWWMSVVKDMISV